MTPPRCHQPGQTVEITRRTVNGQFFIRPDEHAYLCARYELARSAQSHGLDVHGFVAMSNHVHLVTTDESAKRSDAMRDLFAGISKARNRHIKRSGYVWDSRGYDETVILDQEALDRKLLYTWLNPVRARIVERVEDYPGFMILPKDWGTTVRVERPSGYGRKSPEVVEFVPQPPPGYRHRPVEEVRAHFETLIAEGEQELARQRKEAGSKVLGAERAKRVKVTSRPRKPVKKGKRAPRYMGSDPGQIDAAELRHRAFEEAYLFQRRRWSRGKRGCVFPAGTVWIRRHTAARCEHVERALCAIPTRECELRQAG